MAANPPYATAEDLEIPVETRATLADSEIADAIAKAGAMADSYLASHFTLPLVEPYPADLRQAVAAVATYRAMRRRGYTPGEVDQFKDAYLQAVKWFEDVSAGRAVPQVRGSNADAAAQEGGGPSSATFALQPPGTAGGYSDRQEDAWHDSDAVGYAPGGVRKRGW
jgi:phage gp36-like protein